MNSLTNNGPYKLSEIIQTYEKTHGPIWALTDVENLKFLLQRKGYITFPNKANDNFTFQISVRKY